MFILHAILLQPIGLILQLLNLPVELVEFFVGAVDEFILILCLFDELNNDRSYIRIILLCNDQITVQFRVFRVQFSCLFLQILKRIDVLFQSLVQSFVIQIASIPLIL